MKTKNVVISLSDYEEMVLIGFIGRAQDADLSDDASDAIDKLVIGLINAHEDAVEELIDGRADGDDDSWIIFEENYTTDEENALIDALSTIRDSFPEEYSEEEKVVLGKIASAFIADEMGELLRTIFEAIQNKTREYEGCCESNK